MYVILLKNINAYCDIANILEIRALTLEGARIPYLLERLLVVILTASFQILLSHDKYPIQRVMHLLCNK